VKLYLHFPCNSMALRRDLLIFTKTEQLMLFRIRNAVCCGNPMECTNSLHCAASTALLYVKAGGRCNYLYTLEVNEVILGK
jgi:hypothetical protein